MQSSDEEARAAAGLSSPATKPQGRVRGPPLLLAGQQLCCPDATPRSDAGWCSAW
eukprot:CAMPEP_0185358436 /NCGR_PEP_ID=MMETSP1364-20130426/8178_1 /TAXON_ID=38817 /ORGANISM="Gephyrocapsa oceanica, Strain RCC1303" /LENGTH=54 /DNA_ID=CAMNT_0027958543 /DNA_START=351 /DNA_END=512 /DNA_ORIENTATION=-